MATKNNYQLLFKNNNVTDNSQYNNFTLNNQISFDAFSGHSKKIITESRKVLDYDIKNDSKTKRESRSWNNKSTKGLSSFVLNNGNGKEDRLKNEKALSASTLSLYIQAYENSKQANLCDVTKEDLIKKGLNAKQINWNSITVIQNAFEFPRQQGYSEATTPEIAQYRASQQLLYSNLQTNQADVQQPLARNSDGPFQFLQIDLTSSNNMGDVDTALYICISLTIILTFLIYFITAKCFGNLPLMPFKGRENRQKKHIQKINSDIAALDISGWDRDFIDDDGGDAIYGGS